MADAEAICEAVTRANMRVDSQDSETLEDSETGTINPAKSVRR